MKKLYLPLVALFWLNNSSARSAELPRHYFRVMGAGLAQIEKQLVIDPKASPTVRAAQARHLPGAVLAAAVFYSRQHPANPWHGDPNKLALALKLGDLLSAENAQGRFKQLLNHPWGTYFWLEAYRLLEKALGPERRARWRGELKKNVRAIVAETAPRADFPRYQGPFIGTSTNHLSQWGSTIYLAGRVFKEKDWENLGAKVMHRLATREQTADGYWGELTDNGPATGYNYLTLCGVALYWEHSRDTAALEALRRATAFHKYFTWPDGTPVETINGRNRYWTVSPWGHFGFSHFPDGRRYAEFLAGFFRPGPMDSESTGVAQTLGRLAQNALYYHEGPTEPIPLDGPRFAHRLKAPASIRKAGAWLVCLSGLIDPPVESQFTLDRQGHLSVFHEKLGLIVTGANSKGQPELATFQEKTKRGAGHLPLTSDLRLGAEGDRLGLAYQTFFAELHAPAPRDGRLAFRFVVTETGRGRLQEARLNLQLCLKAGAVLVTARAKHLLGQRRIELGPEELGGLIRHRGWAMKLPPTARLVWPVFPFNPYRNAPETDLRHAVAVVSVPVQVQPPRASTLPWRTQEIAFVLEMADR